MITYLLVLTFAVGPFQPLGLPADARPDTLLDGSRAYRRIVQVSGVRQAAVLLLDANRYRTLGAEQWSGELFRVDLDTRIIRPIRLPRITVASDTLTLYADPRGQP